MHKYAIILGFSHAWYEELDVSGNVSTVCHVIDECSGDTWFQSCLEENKFTQFATFYTYCQSRDIA